MSRSNTLRCAAGIVLAVSLLLPGPAAAAPSELIFSPARLWDSFLDLLSGWSPLLNSADSDTGWQIDPDGDEVPAPPSPNNGWLIDPDGDEVPAPPNPNTGWQIDPNG